MNPETGHLVDNRFLITADEARRQSYEALPYHLVEAARRKLAGRKEAYVSLTSGGKLSKHAAARRKARRQMAKASRKKNRT